MGASGPKPQPPKNTAAEKREPLVFRVQGFRVQGFRVQGFRVQGSRVQGFRV